MPSKRRGLSSSRFLETAVLCVPTLQGRGDRQKLIAWKGVKNELLSNIGRRGNIAILEPLNTDVFVRFLSLAETIQIGHEDLQAGLRSHAGIAVHELFLIVSKIEIEPCVIRNIDHDEIDGLHGEPSKVDGAITKLQKIAPLLGGYNIFSTSVNFFKIGVDDSYAG